MSLLDAIKANPTKTTAAVQATVNLAGLALHWPVEIVAAENLAAASWVGVLGASVLPKRRERAIAAARQTALDDVASLPPAKAPRKRA